MTDKATYWIANHAGEKAQVTGAEERDRWSLHGWSQTTEPGEDERVFVWMANPETDHRAAIAWPAREYWMGRGFVLSAPDEPVNPTRDPALVDRSTKPTVPVSADKSEKPAPAASKSKE